VSDEPPEYHYYPWSSVDYIGSDEETFHKAHVKSQPTFHGIVASALGAGFTDSETARLEFLIAEKSGQRVFRSPLSVASCHTTWTQAPNASGRRT
jgi:hypothetical protein